jgi:hypothetical protein
MISIETADGQLVKVIQNISNEKFGFHQLFGFIGSKKANEREMARKRQGFDFTNSKWKFHFDFKANQDGWRIENASGCEVSQVSDHIWSLETPIGTFKITDTAHSQAPITLVDHEDTKQWLNRLLEIAFIATFLLIPILYFMQAESPVEEKTEKEKEKIVVKIVKPVNTVKVLEHKPDIKVKPLSKKEISKRAVKKNLAFLGMLGSKDMKKVVGGVPQKLKKATAGAGKGGDAGSGGELIAGLGKGLKKTTVGNTGTKGLGGIGTKGAGGGKGGYGNTMVAAGEGKGISAIAVSSSQMVLEGGLSRYAINATIAKYLSQVRRCYETQLKFHPELQGVVEVNFEINKTGMLNYSKVKKTTLNNKKVEGCITTKMMGWKFPKPRGGVNVNINYPFMLRPVSR